MAYGIATPTAGQQSRTTDYTVEVAELLDENNNVVEMTTHKAMQETSEDVYLQPGDTFTNTATAGQNGVEVVTGMTLNEKNNDYPQYTVKKRKTPFVATP